MLTRQAIEEFLLSRGGLRPKTQSEYKKHLLLLEKSCPELPETPQVIQGWLNSFQGVTAETVHSRFRTIRAFYKHIHLWHPEVSNPIPLVRPPRLPPKAMRTFTGEELYRLFSLPLSPRDRGLITLLLDIGARAGECAGLTWGDMVPGFVVLRGKTGERMVPISDTTHRCLLALGNGTGGNQHVFLGERGPLTYEGVFKVVRRRCHQAGITGRRCSPHTFRHTFASNYAAAEGCDPKVLQDILGHRDFKSTLRYIQNNPQRMAQNHQRCTPLKLVAAAAQQGFFNTSLAIKEAEEILAKKEEN